MGSSTSVPIDIEAFRPQPQPNHSPLRPPHAHHPTTRPPAAVTSPGLAEPTEGAAVTNGAHRQGDVGQSIASENDERLPVRELPLTDTFAQALANPSIIGKRSRAVFSAGEGANGSGSGQGGDLCGKRVARQAEAEGRVRVAASAFSELHELEPSEIDVGGGSAPISAQAGPEAAGTYAAALDVIDGVSTAMAADLTATASMMVAAPAVLGVEQPYFPPDVAAGARATPMSPPGIADDVGVAPPQPHLPAASGSPPPQFEGISYHAVGVESTAYGSGAPPPTSYMPSPVAAIESMLEGSIAAADRPDAASDHPRVYPVSSGGSHPDAGTGLISFASAGVSGIAALPQQLHFHQGNQPLLSLPTLDSAKLGMREENGGGLPRPQKTQKPATGKRRERRKCGLDGCKRRPTFGVEGTRQAQFCLSHKPEGFVNVLCKQCDVEGCKRQPSFGVEGAKPVRCAAHRSEGMVNLSALKCVFPGCRIVPSFAKPGTKRASACAAHRSAGDVDIVTRRCHHEGCLHRPVFGDVCSGKALYCSAHKLDGKFQARA